MREDEELVGLLYSDLCGIVRGRFVLSSDLPRRLEIGVGWVPANQVITPFDTLVTPNQFGSEGDLRLVPDPATEVRVAADGAALHFLLCGAYLPDGGPWKACPRAFLSSAALSLEHELDVTAHVAFEHEFRIHGPAGRGPAFSLQAMRALEPLPTEIFGALDEAGLEPELFLAEFGPGQFEVPCAPAPARLAADRSAAFKEVVRDVARRRGARASFAPLETPSGATSGVHIHISLINSDGRSAMVDAGRPLGLSELAEAFACGILDHARALSAFTASCAVSGLRLGPGHWSAGKVVLARADREALLRVAMPAKGEEAERTVHLEYRGADATASPHLALAALLCAGLDGVRRGLRVGARRSVAELPVTLSDALAALDADEPLAGYLPPLLLDTFLTVKRGELAEVAELDAEARCARYAAVY